MRQYTCIGVLKDKKEKWTERLLKIYFSKLLKDKQPQIEEIQRVLVVTSTKKTPPRLPHSQTAEPKIKEKFS